ncbi:MAG TPA: hypothetical protein VIH16_01655 [Bellilinea sp.]
MNLVLLNALRILHVFGGVLWVGAAIFYLFYVAPSVKAIGPAGGQFMGHLVEKRKYPVYMGISSVATVVSGAVLFTYVSGNFNPKWITSGVGMVFTIGSVAAFIAFLMGFGLIKPRAVKVNSLGKRIASAGGPPDPALLAELHAVEAELTNIERIEFVFLAISLVAMAIARYTYF